MIKGLAEWWESAMEGEPDPWMTRRDAQFLWAIFLGLWALTWLTVIYLLTGSR